MSSDVERGAARAAIQRSRGGFILSSIAIVRGATRTPGTVIAVRAGGLRGVDLDAGADFHTSGRVALHEQRLEDERRIRLRRHRILPLEVHRVFAGAVFREVHRVFGDLGGGRRDRFSFF